VHAWVKRNPGQMALVTNPQELKIAINQKKIANMMGVEGGHMIEEDLVKLQQLFNRGARYMTLTWNNSTSWASSAADEKKGTPLVSMGLSDFGKEVVRKMNALGMLIDLSHVGEKTFADVMAITTKPVLVSHSCAYTLCPVSRNLKDEQIKAIAKNGGVIHLNFYSGFLDSNFQRRLDAYNTVIKTETDAALAADPMVNKDSLRNQLNQRHQTEGDSVRPPLSVLLDHLDYIVKLAGIDHVGLGSDFDGVSSTPQGLDDVTCFPLITEALVQRGYSKKDIKKILGGNFLRLFEAVQP
jgi:membrane dipeptidase